MKRDKDPWSRKGQGAILVVIDMVATHLLGWKAMPLAREDFDSNYTKVSTQLGNPMRLLTFVSMLVEDCMLTARWKPQSKAYSKY